MLGSDDESTDAPATVGEGEAGDVAAKAAPAKPASSGRLVGLVLLLALVAGGLYWLKVRGQAAAQAETSVETPAEAERRRVAERPPMQLQGKVGLEVEDAGSPTPKVLPPAQLELACHVVAWQKGRKLGETNSCDDHGGWELTIDAEVNGVLAVEVLVPGRLRGVVEIEVEGRGSFQLPELALGIGYPLEGQVLNSAREPLAGVEVQAMPEPNLGEPEPWRAVSDAQGRFRFDTLPAGPVNLNGSKVGFASSVVDAIAPGDEVLLVLDTLVRLEGEVIADAELLSRARVRLEGSAVWPALDKELSPQPATDAAAARPGAFFFDDLVDGVYGVEVYVPAQKEFEGEPEYASIPLENVEPSMRVTLALVRAFRVPVLVVDPEDNPVANARVSLGYGTVAMLQKHALADLDGKARLGPVVPGPYWLRAEADGFLPAVPVPLDVNDAAPEVIKLVLARPATVRGEVRDERGNPVADAEVWLDADQPFLSGESQARAGLIDAALGLKAVGTLGVTTGPVPPIPSEHEADLPGAELGFAVRSDQDGAYELNMLPPGKYSLRARHGGHAESRSVEIELVSGEVREEVVLVLREGQPLTGRVLDANGQPIEGAIVQVGDELIGVEPSGAFDAGLWKGKVLVTVRAPGMVPLQKSTRVSSRAVELEFELEPADGLLELRVVDSNGKPIVNAEVMVQADDGLSPTAITWSDDAGLITLEGLTKGPSVMRVGHLDYVSVQKALDVGARSGRKEFVLDAGWTLEVLVRAAGSGQRLAEANVEVEGQVVVSNDEGIAIVQRLASRAVQVKVQRAGWGRAEAKVRRPADAARFELTVELEEAGGLAGMVTDDIGEPVAGAKVRVNDGEGKRIAEVKTKADGSFEVTEVPEGEVELIVSPPASLAPQPPKIRENSDVNRGQVTKGLQLRFERG